jgi:spore coat protein A, manganese oxidase
MNRRTFMKTSAAALALAISKQRGYAFSFSPGLKKFLNPLPGFGGAIPLAKRVPDHTYTDIDYYSIEAGMYPQDILGSSRGPTGPTQIFPGYTGTKLYGYRSLNALGTPITSYAHLGNAILATKGKPVRIKLKSSLLPAHIIPFDKTIPMGLPVGVIPRQDRIAVHLHGGLVPWTSDGGPFHWIDPAGGMGASLVGGGWLPDESGALNNDIWYPNNQSPRLMWYHDHAIGITRINAYAGLASGYLIQQSGDHADDKYGMGTILVFQDKVFWDPLIDPNFNKATGGNVLTAQAGDLWYPYLYEKARWKLNGNAKAAPIPSAIPEFFGDTMLVNGVVYPTATVPAGAVRFRMLNACNARFLNLKFVLEDPALAGEPQGGYLAPVAAPVDAWLIGTEGGSLPAYVKLLAAGVPQSLNCMLMGPAERFDLLVDFSAVAGAKIILYNDAPAPYPIGAPLADFYPGATGNPVITAAGAGPNTRTLLKFTVGAAGSGTAVGTPIYDSNPVLPTVPDTLNGGLKLTATPGTLVPYGGVQYAYLPTTQDLTLNEVFDAFGRLQQLVGTTVPLVKGTFGRTYLDAPTEKVTYKTIQIWNIYNLTADTHPMHFHLFNVMVLRRRMFKVSGFNGFPVWTGPGRGPELGEEGWKETVKMWPGECTTVAVLVEPPLVDALGQATRTVTVKATANPAGYTGTLPTSPRLVQFGLIGDEYVWHCHILEHEEHDMMRPLVAS